MKQNIKVFLLSGILAVVNIVQPIDTVATVYNFEVEKTHTYYVGTEGVLVHNNCLKDILTAEEWGKLSNSLILNELNTTKRLAFYKLLKELNDPAKVKNVAKYFGEAENLFKLKFIDELGKPNSKFVSEFFAAKPELKSLLATDNGIKAWERVVNSGISNFQFKYKKFPESQQGYNYVLEQAKKYQGQVGGHPDYSFELNGVSFDAFRNINGNKVLIDAKYGHSSIVDEVFDADGITIGDYTVIQGNRATSLREQAEKQIRAANGVPIEWHISTEKGARTIQTFFNLQQPNPINIVVKYIPIK